MKKNRIIQKCKVCNNEFEIRPCEINSIVNCSKECSLKYRSIKMSGRLITWGDKISKSNIGKVKPNTNTVEAREKISKTLRYLYTSGYVSKLKGRKHTPERIELIRKSQIGHNRSGWKLSEENCRRMSESKKGNKSHLWKGGITHKSVMIRMSFEYKIWRRSVFQRDDYTCQSCKDRGVKLHAHHIKSFAKHIENRLDVNNGQTLCIPCHKKTDTYLKGSHSSKPNLE